jgi:hypothetical protein
MIDAVIYVPQGDISGFLNPCHIKPCGFLILLKQRQKKQHMIMGSWQISWRNMRLQSSILGIV